ncbi:MAG: alpha/beta hydrolase [Proteobacteria bacterium]|nr:alpha/beta hydrolase [Pseudomonadota bacterium]
MFSRDDAVKLRESLAAIDFNTETDVRNSLLESYLNHYGLNFFTEMKVSHSVGNFESGEFTLVCHYFSVPLEIQQGTAFLLHGYFDHSGLFGHLIKHCLQLGYAVVIFDQPGHGLSSGSAASIDSFRQYSDALLECFKQAEAFAVNQPWVVIGQSTGAAVIMDALLSSNLTENYPIQRFILLGPLLRPKRWRTSRLLFSFTHWFLKTTPRSFAENSHDEAFLNFLRSNDALQSDRLPRDWVLAMIEYHKRFARAETSNQVLHIIQGTGDETVDWQFNLSKIQVKFPQSKIYLISDARHHLVNESPAYRDKVFTSIDRIVEGIG